GRDPAAALADAARAVSSGLAPLKSIEPGLSALAAALEPVQWILGGLIECISAILDPILEPILRPLTDLVVGALEDLLNLDEVRETIDRAIAALPTVEGFEALLGDLTAGAERVTAQADALQAALADLTSTDLIGQLERLADLLIDGLLQDNATEASS
ncbi:MAG: hypothetical protein KC620_19820, partial [Myxococcales bacterium]|nr:hypothetical protein [Myxococcales bacterium]